MFASEDEALGPKIGLNLDERSCRALSSAINYTLDKWAGEGKMDQEKLLELKFCFQAILLEFQLHQ